MSVAVALLAVLAPGEAAGQFFHLEGFIECIDHPEAPACRERLRPPGGQPAPEAEKAPAPPPPDAVLKKSAPPSGHVAPSREKDAASAMVKPAAPGRPRRPKSRPPPLASNGSAASAPSASTVARPPGETPATRFSAADLKRAIARVQANRAAATDMAVLEAKAAENEPAAVEVLAWCRLYGCGRAPDRVEAYRLYGRAAALSVPHARENQRIVFEHLMTDGERQKVLDAENGASGDPRRDAATVPHAPAERLEGP
jgi:TPR repeat protein